MSSPLVSVCIPAYNNADYIRETIDSVLASTYNNLELIVVDDNSIDDTYAVVERIIEEKADDRVRLYKNEHNLGMAGNWNVALSKCSGKYIKLICADDLISAECLAKEVEVLEQNKEAVTVSSDTAFVDLLGNTKKFSYKRYHASGLIDGIRACRFSVFTRDYLGAPLANTFRKSAYDSLGGFDNSFHYIIDYDFFMKLYLSGKVYIIHEPLNFFRVRNDSNTGNVMGGGKEDAYIDEHRRLVEKYKGELGLSDFGVSLSVSIRRLMSFLGNIYLKISVPR